MEVNYENIQKYRGHFMGLGQNSPEISELQKKSQQLRHEITKIYRIYESLLNKTVDNADPGYGSKFLNDFLTGGNGEEYEWGSNF